MLLQFSLTIVALLICAGAVAALAGLLAWQERAADPDSRRLRLVRAVLPVTSVLLLLLLGAVFSLMMLWSPQGAAALASL
ncbi:hypothetical protein [Hymenobacter yonginensis]|jgi:uncharacterized membrane protein YidH (DUF202 family)|uniref:Uncharacterized protein n=1 Tax=Hymenobacter yonginensis TaxID=748197 RepID=A0ABY7PMI3_9BACT|nr:hypothetical protein [Hymenobacter yonginensis]WBO83235.1 hypothetical protein O9Z63_12685 [Hymenobacter yonginensis]